MGQDRPVVQFPIAGRQSCARCLAPRRRSSGWWVLCALGALVHLCDGCWRTIKGDA